jgi:hypothetical protein
MKDQLTKASPSFQKAISHQLELMLANQKDFDSWHFGFDGQI